MSRFNVIVFALIVFIYSGDSGNNCKAVWNATYQQTALELS